MHRCSALPCLQKVFFPTEKGKGSANASNSALNSLKWPFQPSNSHSISHVISTHFYFIHRHYDILFLFLFFYIFYIPFYFIYVFILFLFIFYKRAAHSLCGAPWGQVSLFITLQWMHLPSFLAVLVYQIQGHPFHQQKPLGRVIARLGGCTILTIPPPLLHVQAQV